MLAVSAGFSWDIQWHYTLLRESAFTPPHLLLISGVALSMLYAGALWLRWKPHRTYLQAGIISGALFYVALAVDDLFHRLFGVDNSIWSPPHLGLMLSCTGGGVTVWLLFRRVNPSGRLAGLVNTLLLALVIDGPFSLLTQAETGELFRRRHELLPGGVSLDTVYGAPLWVYPAYTMLALTGITVLLQRLNTGRWRATGPISAYLAVRSLVAVVLAANGFTFAFPPFHFLPVALLIDLTWRRAEGTPLGWLLPAGVSLAVTLVYAWVLRPVLPIPPHDLAYLWLYAGGALAGARLGKSVGQAPRAVPALMELRSDGQADKWWTAPR